MKIQIKDLHSHTFDVDCETNETVAKLKEILSTTSAAPEKYNPKLIKLVYVGKVMDDDETIESFGLDPEKFVLLVKLKQERLPKTKSKKPPNTGFGELNSPFNMNPMPNMPMITPFKQDPLVQQPHALKSNFLQTKGLSTQPLPSSGFSTDASTSFLAPNFSAGTQEFIPPATIESDHFSSIKVQPSVSEREAALSILLSMGFEKSKAEKALRSSAYTLELAIEFLTSDNIPEFPSVHDSSVPPVPQRPTVSSAELTTPSPPAQHANPFTDLLRGDKGATLNLKEIAMMLQKSPEHLQTIKQALEIDNPQMAKMIDEDAQGFINLLLQAGDNDNNQTSESASTATASSNVLAHAGSGSVGATDLREDPLTGASCQQPKLTVSLSPYEQQIIKEIEDMGFDRNHVIEAFLACERNKELATNYLLDSSD